MMGNKIRGAKVTQPLNLLQGGRNACKAVRRLTTSNLPLMYSGEMREGKSLLQPSIQKGFHLRNERR